MDHCGYEKGGALYLNARHEQNISLMTAFTAPGLSTYACFRILLLLCMSCTSRAFSLSRLPPHAGYHGGAAAPGRPFFEGWYLRVVIPNDRNNGTNSCNGASSTSFALIHHIFDPHLPAEMTTRRQVGLQVLRPDPESSVTRTSPDVTRFHASANRLDIGMTRLSTQGDFFQLSDCLAIGSVSEGKRRIDYHVELQPQVGWGTKERQYSTAGWLAAFPIFEPHYQVLMSKALAAGHITVYNENKEKTYTFQNATAYLEKNWGGSFPSQWWWIQANTFANAKDLTLTSTGGRRRLPLSSQEEEVALVGIHWKGDFLPFSTVQWNVQWGKWNVFGQYEDYSVKLRGSANENSTRVPVDCPTESGMQEIAFETFSGYLELELYQNGKLLLNETTHNACLETGGLPWATSGEVWRGESAMKEPLKSIVMNPDFERKGADALQIINFFVNIPGL